MSKMKKMLERGIIAEPIIKEREIKLSPFISELEACGIDEDGEYFDEQGIRRHEDWYYDSQGIRRHKDWYPRC